MKYKIINLSIFFLASISALPSAQANEIICPSSITIKSAHLDIDNLPDDWMVSEKKDALLLLDGFGVYSDNPAKKIQQKPDAGIIDGKEHQTTWSVNTTYDQGGSWVSCDYNYGEVNLIKKIATTMKSCWEIDSMDQFDRLHITLKCSTSELQEVK
ncbi:MAG: hypothetical protein J6569_06230 [Gilliamella sp.]|uniref:STY0301 family protein n=1 Tax=unclassified Gilliamella TaxID=2685620 RepID=UPI00080DFE38|nr:MULTISPECIES: STY0301 family protein [Gilliamella]MCO6539715.1 hypothetical protein [Gilliamella sp.]MCO6548645.1 hypothetical protein [Gilliamella sp.]MCO6555046.1 hypothetical protein [Gilliamella sp.]MCO6557475.1 hypothetical protein [Gilliamella sp.]OCG77412.1 hypothetical protein A9G44_05045 [Gilliamella apicola]